jgi:hypothetical protein
MQPGLEMEPAGLGRKRCRRDAAVHTHCVSGWIEVSSGGALTPEWMKSCTVSRKLSPAGRQNLQQDASAAATLLTRNDGLPRKNPLHI